jgi:hypothetical protein
MLKIMGAKRKERDKIGKTDSDNKWWKFMRKTKVKPAKQLDIQHNVNFDQNYDGESEYYEMNNFLDRDNNHYRYVNATHFLRTSWKQKFKNPLTVSSYCF